MKKTEEKKLIKTIKESLGENFIESDMLLINELIDWLKISNRAKADLAQSVDDEGSMGWQPLTTIAMAGKHILAIQKALGITPEQRIRNKANKDNANSAINNLNEFLNG